MFWQMHGSYEFDVLFADNEAKIRRILSQEAPQKLVDFVESKKANPEKKKQIVLELLKTEKNYVRQLELIDEVRYLFSPHRFFPSLLHLHCICIAFGSHPR